MSVDVANLAGWACVLSLVSAACAPRVVVTVPAGSGTPDSAAESAYAEFRPRCDAIHTWSGELAAAGRVRNQRVRVRVLAGTSDRGDVRLEGLAPFGAPAFLLVAAADRATLLLPRDESALQDEATAQVLDALVGIPVTAADLHALLTGCLVAPATPRNGRALDAEWMSVELGQPDRVAYLRRGPAGWRIEAGRLGALRVGYAVFEGTAPREIRLMNETSGRDARVELELKLAQTEDNPTLPREAFELQMPPRVRALTLDELRSRGLSAAGS